MGTPSGWLAPIGSQPTGGSWRSNERAPHPFNRSFSSAGVYWAVYELEWDVHLGLEYQTLDRAKRYLAKALEQPTSDA